jgi:hypothetical protein
VQHFSLAHWRVLPAHPSFADYRLAPKICNQGNTVKATMDDPLHAWQTVAPFSSCKPMDIFKLDPLRDPRWAAFVSKHSRASIFHTVEWLKALYDTYAYAPVVFTTTPPPAELQNGVVFCDVKSVFTGHRMVSLPFSDHCDPLVDSPEEQAFVFGGLQAMLPRAGWKYLELRPIHACLQRKQFEPVATYYLHKLDISPPVEKLLKSFDSDSVQRRIRHAERAGLLERCGTSEALLTDFFDLMVITRRRHRVPPQPYTWFRNLIFALRKRNAVEIRIAYKNTTPVAAIVTLRFRQTVYYKYGASDSRFNKLGATPLLLWHAILDAKSSGATEFDLGRTAEDNPGLVAFKSHWAPHPAKLVYFRFPAVSSLESISGWKLAAVKRICAYMPDRALRIAGEIFYRHIG